MNFFRETHFEESRIGKVPEDWKVTSLETVAEIRGNKGMKAVEKIAFIPMESVSDSQAFVKYEVKKREDIRSFTYCEAGDLLLAKITPSLENGKQGIVPLDVPGQFALATTEVFPIHALDIHTLYLFYVLKYPKFRNKIITSMIGSTGRQRASKESVQRLEIPLPSASEQKAIANLLSEFDYALELADRVIAKTERLKKGLMQQLLTHGIGHTETKQTPIGKMPKDWKVMKIGDVASHVGSGLTPRGGSNTYLDKGIPLIRSQNVLSNKLELSDVAYISQETHKFMQRSTILSGDVLLNITGASIGRVTVVPDSIKEANVNQHVCRIRFSNQILPEFAAYYLSSADGQNQIMSFQSGATRQGLNYQQVRAIQLPCPSFEEQKKIAEIMSTIDSEIDTERREKSTLERMKQGLMDLLLTGKVRIRVD